MTLDLDPIVRVTATITPRSTAGQAFGRTLFAYTGDASPATRAGIAGARARDLGINRYASLAAVDEAYDTDDPAREAAARYFAQLPYPRDLLTSGWVTAGAVGYVLGDTGYEGDTILNALKALGTLAFVVAGQSVDVDFNVAGTGDTGWGQVAAAIQTAVRTSTSPLDLSAVDVTYDATNDALQMEIPVGLDIGGPPTGAGADGVGLSAAEDGVYYPGRAAEDIEAFLNRTRQENDTWDLLVLDPDLADSQTGNDVVEWANDNEVVAVLDTTGSSALVANESTSRTALIAAEESEFAIPIWSNEQDNKAAGLAALLSGIDFDAAGTTPTLFGKTIRGAAVDDLTTAQRNELERKRVNYYTEVGGTDVIRPGVTSDADWWADTRFWLSWLVNRIQTDVYALLTGSPRVPQTDRGVGRIQAAVEAACEVGVRNGGLAPGPLTAATADEVRRVTGRAFDGTLSRGYLVYVAPVSSQTQADRAARKAPPISVWLKSAGAVHEVDIALSFTD